MNGEVDLDGVFVSSLLICAVIGLLLTAAVRSLLSRIGFYRLVWHQALFDFALFVILWGAATALGVHFGGSSARAG